MYKEAMTLASARCPSCGGEACELTTPDGAYALDCKTCGSLTARLGPNAAGHTSRAECAATLRGNIERGYALVRMVEEMFIEIATKAAERHVTPPATRTRDRTMPRHPA